MNCIHKLTALVTIALLMHSCEDPVQLDSEFEQPQLVVDAWLTNESTLQTITLTESQDYFQNGLPTPVTNATVTVANGAAVYEFDNNGDGTYTWMPSAGETLGSVGNDYSLSVTADGTSYTASTAMYRVPTIDSISVYFEDEAFGGEEGLYAELYARDLPGKGDTYWVKSYRNDTLLNRPQELNIIYDAVFDAGNDIDGIYFIRPLRFAINALDDEGFPRPLQSGDKVTSEIHSISNEAFTFMQTVFEQTTNGDNTIFALPVANARSNVTNVATGERALGFFNVAAVSTLSKIVE